MSNIPMLSDLIKHEALNAGFDLVGIADSSDPALKEASGRYKAWLDGINANGQKYPAEMHYLRKHAHLKANPQDLLASIRSVICVGLYYGPQSRLENDRAKPLVSQYARGPDYHMIIGQKLSQLSNTLLSKGVETYPFVDSRPVFERFWAWRAGLGWIGKNGMLIHRKRGSFFFLGGLFTSAKLKPDEPETDHCARCKRCIEACPTGAILPSLRMLDANRCIAYHTIENRGLVPEDIAAKTDRWIAGCDICQDVCPYNVKQPNTLTVQPDPFSTHSLADLATWDEPRFRRATKGYAVSRMKYAGFLRNVRCLRATMAREGKKE